MSFAETSIPLRKNSKLLHTAGALDAASDDGHVKWSDLKKVLKLDGQQEDAQSAMSRPLKRSHSIPTEDDELELYHEYKAKLAKLRKEKACRAPPTRSSFRSSHSYCPSPSCNPLFLHAFVSAPGWPRAAAGSQPWWGRWSRWPRPSAS